MATRSAKLAGSSGDVMRYLLDEERTLASDVQAYYSPGLERGLAFGEVWGRGAEKLGITGGLTAEQFGDLFEGRWQGQQLARSGYRKQSDGTTTTARTPMIDVVFALPKSASVALVRADPELRAKMQAGVMRAAHAAFQAVEDHARMVRVPKPVMVGADGKKVYGTTRETANLIAVPTLQWTARPTDITVDRGVSDPHCHVHVTAFTLAERNGKWYTADEFGLKNRANVELRDGLFMSTVAAEWEALGVALDVSEFDRSKDGRCTWEVADRNPDLDRYCSTNQERTWQLRKDFEEKWNRQPTDAELTQLLKVTRNTKAAGDKVQDSRPAWDRWTDNWRSAGFQVNGLDVANKPVGWAARSPTKRLAELVRRLEGPQGLTRADSIFTGEAVAPAVARCSIGLSLAPEVLAQVTATYRTKLAVVREAADPKLTYFTTNTLLAKEEQIAQAAKRKAASSYPAPSALSVSAAIAAEPCVLDHEQVGAVRAICGRSGWVHIEGYAGAGKSTALRAAVAASRDGGACDQVVVTSPAAATAERTSAKVGADRYGSVESVLAQVRSGGLRPTERTMFIVDEAAFVGTHQMADLVAAAGPARFVLVGDPKQLEAIGAAGWYAASVERFGAVQLSTVHRQRNVFDVAAYEHLRNGRAGNALNDLAQRERVHIASDQAQRLETVMADYGRHRDQGRSAADVRIIVDSSNADVDVANRWAQRDRKARGEIRGDGFDVAESASERRWTLHHGDLVVFLRGHIHGSEEPVRNGESGVVLSLDEATGHSRVLLESQRIVTVPLQREQAHQPLGLAYAMHEAKFQGGECAVVLAMPGSDKVTTLNSAYSTLTRSIDETHVYLDNETHGKDAMHTVAEAWSRPHVKRTATWHIDNAAETITYPNRDEVERTPVASQARFAEEAVEHSGRREDWRQSWEAEVAEVRASERFQRRQEQERRREHDRDWDFEMGF